MRMLIALPLAILAILASGCSSKREGGLTAGHRLEKAEHLVLVPLDDSLRQRVRVAGTGRVMTEQLRAAFAKHGYAVTVAKSPADEDIDRAVADSSGTILICGTLPEWEPDLRVVIAATRVGSDEMCSFADVAIGSADIYAGARRADLIPALADQAVDTLVNPPAKPEAAEDRTSTATRFR